MYAITILNENGIKNAEFVKFYNDFSKINNIEATIFDENGKKVKKIPSDKIQDYSAISGFSLYEDNRVKYIDPNYRVYPFTIEYSYTIKHNGLLNYPIWQPYNDFNVATIHSEFQLIIDKNSVPRFYFKNSTIKPDIKIEKSSTIYTWNITNIKSIEEESYSPDFSIFTPNLMLAPSIFSIDGYEGNAETWEGFGKWINELNKGKNNLSETTKIVIKNLVKDCKNKYDSVATIYNYMQNKTRYVSIQEGIGSWQPFEAETVDRLGYGDCKALANYTKSLLEAAGIESNYILIRAGQDAPNIITEFPSNQFNHAIVCVPDKNDTIWLECTSPYSPAGYMGTFTDDRDALLIDKNGGKIVHTPVYSAEENKKIRKTEITLDNNGNGIAVIKTNFTGTFYDEFFPITVRDNKDKKEMIYSNIKFANFNIKDFNYIIDKLRLPVLHESLNLDLREYASKMNNLLIVDITSINKINQLPVRNENRISNIYIKRPITEIDSILITYPENYICETTPANISINSDFGKYSLDFFPDKNKMLCVRTLKVNKGDYLPIRYNEFVEFYKKLFKADNAKLVLKEK